jgi:hypothetical protein
MPTMRAACDAVLHALGIAGAMTSEVPAYRWLNTAFVVAEGEIDEDLDEVGLSAYVCVNEAAQGPPAVGSPWPARYRWQA